MLVQNHYHPATQLCRLKNQHCKSKELVGKKKMKWHQPINGGSAAYDKISFWLFLNKIILIGDLSAEWITNPEKVTEKITKEACD